MSKHHALILAVIACIVSACSTVMPVPPSTAAAAGLSSSPVPVDPSLIRIEAVQWRGDAGALSAEETASLRDALQQQLAASIARLPMTGSGRGAVVHAAITQVNTVSPGLNAASAFLLFVPLDRGGAAVEIEAVDAATGERVAILSEGYYPPMREFKARFKRLKPAEIALAKLADDFTARLAAAPAE